MKEYKEESVGFFPYRMNMLGWELGENNEMVLDEGFENYYLHQSNRDIFMIYYNLFRIETGGLDEINILLNSFDENSSPNYERKNRQLLPTYYLLEESLKYLKAAYNIG